MNEEISVRKWANKGRHITIALNDSAQHRALYRALHQDAEEERIPISRKIRQLLLKIYKIEGE